MKKKKKKERKKEKRKEESRKGKKKKKERECLVVYGKVVGPCMGKEKKKVKKYYFNKNRYIIDNLM